MTRGILLHLLTRRPPTPRSTLPVARHAVRGAAATGPGSRAPPRGRCPSGSPSVKEVTWPSPSAPAVGITARSVLLGNLRGAETFIWWDKGHHFAHPSRCTKRAQPSSAAQPRTLRSPLGRRGRCLCGRLCFLNEHARAGIPAPGWRRRQPLVGSDDPCGRRSCEGSRVRTSFHRLRPVSGHRLPEFGQVLVPGPGVTDISCRATVRRRSRFVRVGVRLSRRSTGDT